MYVPFSAIIKFFCIPYHVLVHTPGGMCTSGWESLMYKNFRYSDFLALTFLNDLSPSHISSSPLVQCLVTVLWFTVTLLSCSWEMFSLYLCHTSKWTKIKYGVPQGSILGPLLFLVYINDLPKAVEHKVLPILFADDTSILVTSPNNIQMQRDLNKIFMQLNMWFKSNLLSLNFDKTSFIYFTKSTCKLNMKTNRYVQLMKQNFLGYSSITISLEKHTLTVLSPN